MAHNAEHNNESINFSGFDKWAMAQRVKQSNRKWFSSQIIKAIAGIAIGLFIAKAMRGG